MAKHQNEPPTITEVSPTTVQSLLSISREIEDEDICKRGSDAFAARLHETLRDFSPSVGVMPSYEYRVMKNEAFTELPKTLIKEESKPKEKALRHVNQLFFREILRPMEAYEFVTIWRAQELARGCVNCLNADLVIPAAVIARSLVELGVRYLLAAKKINNYFKNIPWEKFETGLIRPWITYGKKEEDLEHYIIRLLWGTRLKERLKSTPVLDEKTILDQIDEFDRLAKKLKEPYSLRTDYYEFLCEISHPNYVGNFRYAEQMKVNEEWITYGLSSKARKADYEFIVVKTCGALSLALECVSNGYSIFQETAGIVGPHLR
jgi:hypothetical protein